MKAQTEPRIVLVICLVALAAICLYVPSYITITGTNGDIIASGVYHYRWVWNLVKINAKSTPTADGTLKMLVDYGLLRLEGALLTAIVGFFLAGVINKEVGRYHQRHAEQHTTCEGCLYVRDGGWCYHFTTGCLAEGEVRACYRKRLWRELTGLWREKRGKP